MDGTLLRSMSGKLTRELLAGLAVHTNMQEPEGLGKRQKQKNLEVGSFLLFVNLRLLITGLLFTAVF